MVKAKWNIYLGYLNDATGIYSTKDKVQAIKEAPVPNDITQLRVFVVLIKASLRQVAAHMAPLHKLIEKNHKWSWSAECHNVF